MELERPAPKPRKRKSKTPASVDNLLGQVQNLPVCTDDLENAGTSEEIPQIPETEEQQNEETEEIPQNEETEEHKSEEIPQFEQSEESQNVETAEIPQIEENGNEENAEIPQSEETISNDETSTPEESPRTESNPIEIIEIADTPEEAIMSEESCDEISNHLEPEIDSSAVDALEERTENEELSPDLENFIPEHQAVEDSLTEIAVRSDSPQEQEVTVPIQYPTLPTEVLPDFKIPEPIEHRKIIHQFEDPKVAEVNTNQLLSEEQLRSFYLNEELEIVDDFVDAFVENEQLPNQKDQFMDLLCRYLEACRHLEVKETELAELERKCQNLNDQIWVLQTHTVTQTGRCGDDRSASGSANYQTAKMRPETLTHLQQSLVTRAKVGLDEKILLQSTANAASLQCYWCVVRNNQAFMNEHRLTLESPACIMFGTATNIRETATRIRLRFCLSALFHFTRMPMLPNAFVEDTKKWITELGAVLLKASTEVDHQFLLCHLLRCSLCLDNWAVSLIQPYCMNSSADVRAATDHFVALLYLLLNPIKRREEFLNRFVQSELEDQDNSWTVVDDDGEEEESRLLATTESDLLAMLNQFNFAELFGNLIKQINFYNVSESDVLTLFAFHLTTTKVLFDGMQTYNRPQYRQLCKQIGYVMRQSVRYVAECWESCREALRTQPSVLERLQREFDRLLLFGVHCLISSEKLGVWQFLVDFPFRNGSADCLAKIQLLLWSPHTYRFMQLCNMSVQESTIDLTDASSLHHRLHELDSTDGTYLLSALSNVATASGDLSTIESVTTVLFMVCFVNAETRDEFHKVGSEAMSSFVEKQPMVLSTILRLIDRHLDSLDSFAPEVLSLAPLSSCTPQIDDLVLCGKWLVGQSPASHGCRLARRLLGSFNWGPDNRTGLLSLTPELHLLAAETVAKAHIAHCKAQNGLITASIKKASKIALRIPDPEQQFDAFCWDLLLRLKLDTTSTDPPSQPNDLCVFFVSTMRYHVKSPSSFVKSGVPLLHSLLDAGSVTGALWIVSRVVFSFAAEFDVLLASTSFMAAVDKLIHADQSSLVAALLGSNEGFPGKYLNLLSSAIAYQLLAVSEPLVHGGHLHQLISAWIKLLTHSRTDWNSDRSVLYLLDTIVRCLFSMNVGLLDKAIDVLKTMHMGLIQAAAHQSKGVIGWISGADTTPPPLLTSDWFIQFPWISYIVLVVEEMSFAPLFSRLDQVMLKHTTMGLEQALKKACTKERTSFMLERLPYYRWADLICSISVDHALLPLACQQMSIKMLKRVSADSPTCVGLRFLRCRSSQSRMDIMKARLTEAAEHRKDYPDCSGQFIAAVASWLWNHQLYNPYSGSTDGVPMDYLAQLVISGDKEPWLNFVDMQSVREMVDKLRQPFISLSHLSASVPAPTAVAAKPALERLFDRLENEASKCVPPPQIPPVTNAPPPLLDLATLCNARRLLAVVGVGIEEMATKSANTFVSVRDSVSLLDSRLIELLPLLYHTSELQLSIELRCSSGLIHSCSKPVTTKMTVTSCTFANSIDTQVKNNRQQRLAELQKLDSTQIKEACSVQAALLEESINTLVSTATETPRNSERFQSLMDTGLTLFYHIVSSTSKITLLFPVTRAVFGRCMDLLGQKFVSEIPQQQEHLIDVLLQRPELADLLVANFTPNCVQPNVYIEIYERLAMAARGQTVDRSLAMSLASKVDLSRLGSAFGPSDVSALMPTAFHTCVKLASVDKGILYETYKSHFFSCIKYGFPTNFIPALKLVLEACSNGSLPVDILSDLNNLIGVSPQMNATADLQVNPNTATEASQVITAAFSNARANSKNLWSTWKIYFAPLCSLVGFLFVRMTRTIDYGANPTRIEDEIERFFNRITDLFGPWLQPPTGVLIPWTPDDGPSATMLLNQLVACLIHLHNCTEKSLPPGSRNVLSLVFLYYAQKLSTLKRAGTHVHKLYEEQFLKMNWTAFWPDLMALDSMYKVLTESCSDCHPFVTNLLVRIPWLSLEQMNAAQPLDANRAFYALLLEIVVRCTEKQTNYQNCKASFPKLISSLTSCNWSCLDCGALEKCTEFVASNYAPDCVDKKEPDASATLLRLLHHCTGFMAPCPLKDAADQLSKKQSLYVRCHLKLLSRGLPDGTISADSGKSIFSRILAEIETVVRSRGTLTSDAGEIAGPCVRFLESLNGYAVFDVLRKTLYDFLLDHPDAHLVLLLLSSSVSPSDPSLLEVGFGVVETCVSAYFLSSSRSQPNWAEVISWLRIEPQYQRNLRQENPQGPYLLALNGCLLQALPVCQSISAEGQILKEVIRLLNTFKPKMITEEARLLLIIHKMVELLVRQCQFSQDSTSNSLVLNTVKSWLSMQTEEKPGSLLNALGITKKHTYSARFKLVCQVLNLYLIHQSLDSSQVCRLHPNQPITNSRIQAARDLKNNKQFAAFGSKLDAVNVFFTDTQYNLSQAPLLLGNLVKALYIERYLHLI